MKKQAQIKVVIKEVGKDVEVRIIDNTLEALQGIVEGFIQVVPFEFDRKFDIVLNEEGKLEGLPQNIGYGDWDVIVGTLLVTKPNHQTGEFESLDDKEIEFIKEHLFNRSLS